MELPDHTYGTGILVYALRCFSSQQAKTELDGSSYARACGARNDLFFCALRPDFAALDSLRLSQAKRSSQSLTLFSWDET
jgi:hypothetical protein